MRLIDAHNDTAYRMFFSGEPLYNNKLHIDLQKQKGFQTLLFYAIFMDPDKIKGFSSPMAYFEALYENFQKNLLQNNTQITRVTDSFFQSDTPEALLTVEGGSLIESTETIDYLATLGIRLLTLTWNDSNKIAKSAASGESGGLSPFGHQVVDRMNELGILIDLSHASDETFFDVMFRSQKPVVVSHSNARTLCPHGRNITDEMFRLLRENGGVLGINFYPPFLGENADISTVIAHMEHFLELGGENHIGFGGDFDGVDALPGGISDFTGYHTLFHELQKRNWSQELLEKVFYRNFLRLLETR